MAAGTRRQKRDAAQSQAPPSIGLDKGDKRGKDSKMAEHNFFS